MSFTGRRPRDLAICGSEWHRCGMRGDLSDARDPFLRLKESIGSLMFVWCRLDDALSEALEDGAGPARRTVGGSFHERLLRLRAIAENELKADATSAAEITNLLTRLDETRRQRNLIVHSLSGVCADPASGEPHITCQSNEGRRQTSVRITQTALTFLLEDMTRCRQQLGNVGVQIRLAAARSRSLTPQDAGNA